MGRPLSDDFLATPDPQEPRLELVPALDDPEEETEEARAEAAEVSPGVDEDDGPAAEELEVLESAVPAQDPLKLYVHSIDTVRSDASRGAGARPAQGRG